MLFRSTLGEAVWDGVYQPAVQLNVLSSAATVLYAAAEQWQEFNIMNPLLLGDVNDDGVVDVLDINLTINHILGKTSGHFNLAAADVDGNGTIDTMDVNRIINIVLGK